MKEYRPTELTAKHRALVIDLRPARESDGDLLFKWRNDMATRLNSRWSSKVTAEEHARWMTMHVMRGYPVHLVLLGGNNELGPIGAVRFDMLKDDVMAYEVSITVAPEHRRQGLGGMLLMAACDTMSECTLTAEIKLGNSPSVKLFRACGFTRCGFRKGFGLYRREPTT